MSPLLVSLHITVTEQDTMQISRRDALPVCLPPASCLQEKFSILYLLWIPKSKTESEKRENAETKQKSQARQNNNSLAITQIQGPQFLLKGYR